jgi:hypothetical protein
MTPEHGVPSSQPAMACSPHGGRRLLFRHRLVRARSPCGNPAESLRYDSATKDGFVYLPGRDDPYSWLKRRLDLEEIAGHPFHARSNWDTIAQPLLEEVRRKPPAGGP